MINNALLRAGHTPTLFAALVSFDMGFMVWVLLGPLGMQIANDLPKGWLEYLAVSRIGDAWWFMFFHAVTIGGCYLASSMGYPRQLTDTYRAGLLVFAAAGLTSIKSRWRTTVVRRFDTLTFILRVNCGKRIVRMSSNGKPFPPMEHERYRWLQSRV